MQYDPSGKQMLTIAANNVRMFGVWRTLGDILGYVLTGPPRDRFDRRYGVKTSGSVTKWQAGITDEAALADAVRYVPVPERVLRSVFAKVQQVIDPSGAAFVDLGCGKGRGVVMATWLPFRQVHGVELSPKHAELAQANLTAYLAQPRGRNAVRCSNVTVHCANALDFEPPDMDLVVFMYRPFKGAVFTGVLDRLNAFHERTGHRVVIAYACPVEERLLELHGAFARIHDNQVISEEMSWALWECRGAAQLQAPRSDPPRESSGHRG
jgi:SAM-dependent methyltransferase